MLERFLCKKLTKISGFFGQFQPAKFIDKQYL